MLVGQVGQLDLHIGVRLRGDRIEALRHKVVLKGGHNVLRGEHHAGDGLADNAVQRNQDGEGNKGPQAAGHGVDAFLAVEVLHLLIQLLGVALVPPLQLLNTGLETG